MSDVKRNLEYKINRLLDLFPIVIITGSRQCGKTTLAKSVRPTWKYFDLEKGSDFDRVTMDFDFFFKENSEYIIIDEAQNSPQLFNELRGIVDANKDKKNRFLLTGSSSFELISSVSESLPGRAAFIEMGTLKCNEFYQQPLSQFYTIFSNKLSQDTMTFLLSQKETITSQAVKAFFLKGGYPEPVLRKELGFYDLWMEQYFQSYINRDIRKLFPKLNSINYRRFISMLSTLSGTLINKAELGRSLDTSEVTVRDYLEIAHNSFMWRNVLSYENSTSKSIIKMPKGIFRDSGLSHYLKSIKTIQDLDSNPYIGINFEAFVIEEIIKGLQATLITGWDYRYFRTKNGAEVDLILSGNFGILPIEIKYGIKTSLQQLSSLNRFLSDNNLPMGIVINNSNEVRKLSEKIIQIPVGLI